jgi:hypothetical protein
MPIVMRKPKLDPASRCSPIITGSNFGACSVPQNLGIGQKECPVATSWGRGRASVIAALLSSVVERLSSEDLPESIGSAQNIDTVKNPFA